MPTHVVVGASRGIGYAFLETLSKDPNNKVIGLVRTVEPTQKKVDADGLKNVTILHADLTKYTSLLEAAKKVSSISESVDFLWNNGAYLSELMVTKFLTDFDLSEHDKMVEDMQHSFTTNVVGVINAINAFLPLVKKSSIKKVITISTGMADNDLVSKYGIWESASYSSSKAALNNIICKYDAKFRPEGVLFLSLSPGMVDTGGKSKSHDHLDM